MLIGLRSRKHICSFELVRPANLTEARDALSATGSTVLMAGGLDLIDRLRHGHAVDRVVHLAGIRELRGVRRNGDVLSIGALTTHAEIASDPILSETLPDWPNIWRSIANPRVRHAGTIGGNLVSGMPHYDAAPALQAFGASAVILDRIGAWSTGSLGALDDGILVRLEIPVRPGQRLLADRSLHPIVAVYLGAQVVDRTIRDARLVVSCAYAKPLVLNCSLTGIPVDDVASAIAAARNAIAALPVSITDGLASGGYRRRMIEVLARRLLVRLGAQP